MGAAVVCLLTLYAADASYCGGRYFTALSEVVHLAAR
jgi:hypothetical protein